MDAETYYAAQLALFDNLTAGHANATVVPLRAEYVGAATCLTLIHMLSDELSVLIEDRVLNRLDAFQSKHHWYPPSDRHLTLKNVRKASEYPALSSEVIERASRAIDRVCRRASPLEFDILGPVCLSTSIVIRAIGTLTHREMILAFDKELTQAGVPDDKTYASNDVFVGNITVCRFTERPSQALVEAVSLLRDQFIAKYAVRTACLVQCDEVCSSSRVVLREFALRA